MAKNIYWLKNSNQYMVRIKGHYLGTFNTIDEAEQVLKDFKKSIPKVKKFKIAATLNEEQMNKFKALGAQAWLKLTLNKK